MTTHLSLVTTSAVETKTYTNAIVGAATFDLNGLPKEYFTTHESSSIGWVQTIFQAIGLQSLLTASLQIDGFNHAIVMGNEYCAVIVRQRFHYAALLMNRAETVQFRDSVVTWAQGFNLGNLKADDRFQVA